MKVTAFEELSRSRSKVYIDGEFALVQDKGELSVNIYLAAGTGQLLKRRNLHNLPHALHQLRNSSLSPNDISHISSDQNF